MNKAEQRAEPRVPVSFNGTLKLGQTSAKCVIQNMCSRGFLIRSAEGLPVGHHVELTCHLSPDVHCTVQVRHVTLNLLGARVIEVSEEGEAQLRSYLAAQREAWAKRTP